MLGFLSCVVSTYVAASPNMRPRQASSNAPSVGVPFNSSSGLTSSRIENARISGEGAETLGRKSTPKPKKSRFLLSTHDNNPRHRGPCHSAPVVCVAKVIFVPNELKIIRISIRSAGASQSSEDHVAQSTPGVCKKSKNSFRGNQI